MEPLTGDKKEIYTLARKSYFVVKEDGDGGPHDMIHTENFVLVDPEKRIRGYYDGTDKAAIENLLADLKTLKEEYDFRTKALQLVWGRGVFRYFCF